jgi:hypothetical protein
MNFNSNKIVAFIFLYHTFILDNNYLNIEGETNVNNLEFKKEPFRFFLEK